jgi:rare lipoprotein A
MFTTQMQRFFVILLSLLAVISYTLPGCTGSKFTQEGQASYYSNKLQGNKMANGQPYRKGKLTAAHKTLAFGTKVKVTNLKNGKKIKVKITDRGPHVKNRIIDLSMAAAQRLDMVNAGLAPVKIKVVRPVKIRVKS